jgi:hypothetical protein
LPFNPYVELYQNRIGITFEVAPQVVSIQTIPPPRPDYLGATLNVLALVAFLVIIGSQCVAVASKQ